VDALPQEGHVYKLDGPHVDNDETLMLKTTSTIASNNLIDSFYLPQERGDRASDKTHLTGGHMTEAATTARRQRNACFPGRERKVLRLAASVSGKGGTTARTNTR
jgi:hypothetical protein